MTGMPRPTIRDVARAAGVHPGTASRALDPARDGRVTPETARRVREAADRLGYVPDQFGRGLRTGRSQLIGVLVPDLGNPVFPPILRGIEETLRAAGYEAVIASTDDRVDRERDLLETLRLRGADGFIIASSRREDPAVAALVASTGAVVLVNRLVDPAVGTERGADSVASDDDAGVAAAVRHLVGLGHRTIAHVSGPEELSMTTVRRAAFERAVRDAGLDPRDCPVVEAGRYAAEEGERAAARLFDAHAPTAVIAGNDMIAVGCYAELRRRGLRCPDDVSVIGVNDMPLAGFLDPPLTTVAIPQYDIGAAAAELVLGRITHRDRAPVSRILPTRLVVRGSTAAPPR